MSRARAALAMGAGITTLVGAGLFAGRRGVRRYAAEERRNPDSHADDAPVFDLHAEGFRHHHLPTADGGELHVVEKGPEDGRPLVLMHGITLSARIWGYQFRDLSDDFRVIALDLRGHGESRAGDTGFGMAPLAADLVTALEGLDLHRAIVVGHSMGGMGLMHFCGLHTDVLDERVDGVVFLNTSSILPLPALAAKLAKFLVPRAASRGRTKGWDKVPGLSPKDDDLSYAVVRRAFGRAARPFDVELLREITAAAPPVAVIESSVGIADHDAEDALAETKTPALVIGGELDNLTPASMSRRTAELLPNCELHVLDDAGHQIMQERPEELARLLRDFAAEIEAKGPELVAEEQDAQPVG